MAQKVTIDSLASELNKILKEYGDEVDENMDVIVKRIGQKGAQALRNESLDKFPDSGKHRRRYGSTWKTTVERRRLYTLVTIHNAQAGLPHLLEYGHVVSNGTGRNLGQAAAHTHIFTVEQTLIKDFETEVKTKL